MFHASLIYLFALFLAMLVDLALCSELARCRIGPGRRPLDLWAPDSRGERDQRFLGP